jgi:hypothetical protein
MRRLAPLVLPLILLPLLAAKGGKKKDDAPAPPPPVAEKAAPAEAAPEPPPAPEAPKVIKNADVTVSITNAGGTIKSGKVTGIERTIDFAGDEGWTSVEKDLRLTVESGSSEKQVAWKDVKSITVTPGKIPDEVDCSYSSDFSPWMYECILRTNTTVVMKDGSKGNITNRHQWRFTFEDGSQSTFSIFKYSVREQDSKEVEFGEEQTENFGLYTRLQDRLRTELKTQIVKSVSVQ